VVSGLTGVFWPVGLPVFLACVIVAVRSYRKQHLGPLHASQSAQLGAVFGLLSSLVCTSLIGLACTLQPGLCREALVNALKQGAAFNPSPQSQQTLQYMLESDARIFGFFAVGLLMGVAFMVALGAVLGAASAGLSRDKPNS